jgi:hypothetical protein
LFRAIYGGEPVTRACFVATSLPNTVDKELASSSAWL